jgi:hypothetical protein
VYEVVNILWLVTLGHIAVPSTSDAVSAELDGPAKKFGREFWQILMAKMPFSWFWDNSVHPLHPRPGLFYQPPLEELEWRTYFYVHPDAD